MKKLIAIFFVLALNHAFAQGHITNSKEILLDNGAIFREVVYRNDSLFSSFLALRPDSRNFIQNSKDFSFLVDGQEYNGFSGWELAGVDSIRDATGGRGIKVILQKGPKNPGCR